jgi:Flp pilus assembly protein TadD
MHGLDEFLAKARHLLEHGRAAEARDVLLRAIAGGMDGAPIRSLLGLILHALADFSGCARELREAVRLNPDDGAAEFALASILFRLGDEIEAEAAIRRAIAKGMDDIHSYLLLGRIFNRQGRFGEAETAYREAVRRDASSPQAQRELAHLVWLLTGDLVQARAALAAAPQTPEIVAITVRLLQDAGDEGAAFDLAVARAAVDPSLNILAARAGLRIDPRAADRLLASVPPDISAGIRAKAEIEVDLALGRIEQAVRRAEILHASRPADHHATALLAAAWRLADDPRYKLLYNYGQLVKSYHIETPEGWSHLNDYLDDLGQALDRVHGPLNHPIGQSLRHGSQTPRSLNDYPDAPIRALFAAIDAPIRRHLAAMGAGYQDYQFNGAWSVHLKSGGFHVNHIHPEGQLSSAFYVRTPKAAQGLEGYLKFGEPGPPTAPPLQADHLIKPEPGMLVLFPSYMWHGTVPFSSDEPRLSCAFDIVGLPDTKALKMGFSGQR